MNGQIDLLKAIIKSEQIQIVRICSSIKYQMGVLE